MPAARQPIEGPGRAAPGVTILVAETDVVVDFVAFAVRNGHKRVDWTADRNDPRLLAYYQDLGAIRQDDKVFFRLTDEALESLAGVTTS